MKKGSAIANNPNHAPCPQSLETVGNSYYEVWNDTAQACSRYRAECSAAYIEWEGKVVQRDIIVKGSESSPSTIVRFGHDGLQRPTAWLYTFDNHIERPGIYDQHPYRTLITMPNPKPSQEKPDGTLEGLADFASAVLYAISRPGAREHNQLTIERLERTIRTKEENGQQVSYYHTATKHKLTYDHLPDGGLRPHADEDGHVVDGETIEELHRLQEVLKRACDTVNHTTEQLVIPYGGDFDPNYDFVPPLYA